MPLLAPFLSIAVTFAHAALGALAAQEVPPPLGGAATPQEPASLPAVPGTPHDPKQEEIADACSRFGNAPAAMQAKIVLEIGKRIEASTDPALRRQLALRDRAVKEMTVVRQPAREFYDSKDWARGLWPRKFADPDSVDAAEKRGNYRPWENQPFYTAQVVYDFARDAAVDSGAAIDPSGQLGNALFGYLPGSDLLIAWLTKKFDFDGSLDLLADHFGHLYCDLNGKAYADVTLYDAWCSGSGFDMPDVDVIAFARRVLKDDSYTSPIPPDARRAALYDRIRDGFIPYLRYRTWIEAAANVHENPETPLPEVREPLRRRLLYVFALDEGDPDKAAARLAAFKTRDDFVTQVDASAISDPKFDARVAAFADARNAVRWSIARAAYAVLREHSLLAQ